VIRKSLGAEFVLRLALVVPAVALNSGPVAAAASPLRISARLLSPVRFFSVAIAGSSPLRSFRRDSRRSFAVAHDYTPRGSGSSV
jgi:hypothetical protein